MKEPLLNELKVLATAILNDSSLSTQQLKDRAQQLFEKATVLAYAEKKEIKSPKQDLVGTRNTIATPISKMVVPKNNTPTDNTIGILGSTTFDHLKKEEVVIEELPTFDIAEGVLDITFDPAEEVDNIDPKTNMVKEEPKVNRLAEETPKKAPALLHELEDLTEGFDLPQFDSSETTNSLSEKTKISLNDTLNTGFQIGLNDRLAFQNHLFNGNNGDLTRVISQLNTKENLVEAQEFINQIVKPEYNHWEGKEAYELRFWDLIERNFQ